MLAVRARQPDADLVMFPELQLTGYPPEDLVLKPEFVRRTMEPPTAGRRDRRWRSGDAVGSVERIETEDGTADLYNIVALLDGGRVVATRRKHELPNYGTFDEKRVFAPGPLPEPIEWRGREAGRADLRGHLVARGEPASGGSRAPKC